MAVSEQDKNRARKHMGYGAVQQSATFQLGVPAAVQTAFMIEGSWARILPSAEEQFRTILDRLDSTEEQIFEDTENLAATKIGNIELNPKEFEQLIQRYRYWQGQLANMLQCAPNPFDQRPLLGLGYSGGGGLNVPVG